MRAMFHYRFASWEFIVGTLLVIWTLVEMYLKRTVEFITFVYSFDMQKTPIRYFAVIIIKLSVGFYLIHKSREVVNFL